MRDLASRFVRFMWITLWSFVFIWALAVATAAVVCFLLHGDLRIPEYAWYAALRLALVAWGLVTLIRLVGVRAIDWALGVRR